MRTKLNAIFIYIIPGLIENVLLNRIIWIPKILINLIIIFMEGLFPFLVILVHPNPNQLKSVF